MNVVMLVGASTTILLCALAVDTEDRSGNENTAPRSAALAYSPVSNSLHTSGSSDGHVHHDEHLETEFLEISAGRCSSAPDYRITKRIIFRQPRNSGALELAVSNEYVPLVKYLKGYLYDSSGRPPSHDPGSSSRSDELAMDPVRLAKTVADLIHVSWHHDDKLQARDCACCWGPNALPCLVEPSLFTECDIGLASTAIRGWQHLYNCSERKSARSTAGNSPFFLSLSNMRLKAGEYAAHRTAVHITPTNTIRSPYTVFPRRLWDLHTNRVVPAHLCYQNIFQCAGPPDFNAITHSWRPPSELVYVMTPINAFAWPVPLPAGLELEALRKEIQSSQARRRCDDKRYVWLDVLCLRQTHNVPAAAIWISPGDDQAAWNCHRQRTKDGDGWLAALSLERDIDGSLRSSELAIDVPTIGNIYRLASKVLRYLNGLGQPLSLTGWDLPTHWLNRAWTLQEHVPRSIDLGIEHISGNYRNLKVAKGGHIRRVRDHLQEVYDIVSLDIVRASSGTEPTLLGLVAEMGRRFAANEVDKVAGLSYALQLKELPTYAGTAAVEVAWRRCLAVLPPRYIAELFFNCPLVPLHLNDDAARCQWTPTWEALVGLPPYEIIQPEKDRALSVSRGSRGRASMRAPVVCIFPRSIAHVEGTDGDYVIDVGADVSFQVSGMQGGLWEVFVANKGLPRVDLSGTTGRWLIAHPRHQAESWVLLLMLAEVPEDLGGASRRRNNDKARALDPRPRMRCRKLVAFRSDPDACMQDAYMDMLNRSSADALLEAHVDGEIILTSQDESFFQLLRNPGQSRITPRA